MRENEERRRGRTDFFGVRAFAEFGAGNAAPPIPRGTSSVVWSGSSVNRGVSRFGLADSAKANRPRFTSVGGRHEGAELRGAQTGIGEIHKQGVGGSRE